MPRGPGPSLGDSEGWMPGQAEQERAVQERAVREDLRGWFWERAHHVPDRGALFRSLPSGVPVVLCLQDYIPAHAERSDGEESSRHKSLCREKGANQQNDISSSKTIWGRTSGNWTNVPPRCSPTRLCDRQEALSAQVIAVFDLVILERQPLDPIAAPDLPVGLLHLTAPPDLANCPFAPVVPPILPVHQLGTDRGQQSPSKQPDSKV